MKDNKLWNQVALLIVIIYTYHLLYLVDYKFLWKFVITQSRRSEAENYQSDQGRVKPVKAV